MKYAAIGRAGGPPLFWDGYEYELGEFPFFFLAWIRAWIHVQMWPYRAAIIEKR